MAQSITQRRFSVGTSPVSSLVIVSLLIFAFGCGENSEMDVIDPLEAEQPSNADAEPLDIIEEPPEEKPDISFRQLILPIFARNCIAPGCHSDPAPSGLILTDYDSFQKGGRNGPPFIPRNGQRSLIIRRIRPGGMMPLDQPPLGQREIQIIKDWIDQGARDN